MNLDNFTEEFKKLKSKQPPADLRNVIDFDCVKSSLNKTPSQRVSFFEVKESLLPTPIGLKPCNEWSVFCFDDIPGFYFIRNPFINGFQRYWTARCLQDFPSDLKNATNLSVLGHENQHILWSDYVERKTEFSKSDPLWKLRWTTLGYHYDWTRKIYSEDRKAEFPVDVKCLTQYLANVLGFGTYNPEAAIVNYYHLDSTLAAHCDNAEFDHDAPLFSLSFGQSAVFMIGGPTKETKPVSMFLRSGDISVMSGKARLAFHAVPKIMYDERPQACFDLDESIMETRKRSFKNDVVCEEDAKKSCPQNKKNYVTINENANISSLAQSPVDISDEICSSVSHSGKIITEATIPKTENENKCYFTVHSNLKTDQNILKLHPLCDYQVYLSNIDKVNTNILHTVNSINWESFRSYLDSSRINLNVRQVLPKGVDILPQKNEDNSKNS